LTLKINRNFDEVVEKGLEKFPILEMIY
jgi:hypothetical protein